MPAEPIYVEILIRTRSSGGEPRNLAAPALGSSLHPDRVPAATRRVRAAAIPLRDADRAGPRDPRRGRIGRDEGRCGREPPLRAPVLVARPARADPVRKRVLALRAHVHRDPFSTRYDYETRFGRVGRLVDRTTFRPLLGWATAWSFDRLRLSLEQDISPERARRRLLSRAARCPRQPSSVDEEGGLRLRSGEQRFYEGPLGFRFPMWLSGVATVREWYDEDLERFRIDVPVANDRWGPLFGYRGWFHAETRRCEPGEVPQHVRPVREERRE